MDWQVVKIGGSVLRNEEDLLKAAHLLKKKYKPPVAVVVSALNGVTDFLLEQISGWERGKESGEDILQFLKKKHLEMLGGASPDKLEELLQEVKLLLAEDPKTVQKEKVLSYGERLAVSALAAILRSRGIDCQICWPEDFGFMVKNYQESYFVDLEAARKNCRSYFQDEDIYLLPGFYGVDSGGQVRLLGRGGSDYSATALAYCLDAPQVHIWKDVPGVLSADPCFLSKTRPVRSLSYNEAEELASCGAGILHPRAIGPVRAKGITVHFYKFPEGREPATIIKAEGEKGFKSLAFNCRCAALKLSGSGVGKNPAVLARIMSIFQKENIPIKSIHSTHNTMALLLDQNNLEKALKATGSDLFPGLNGLEKIENLVLLALIGEGVREDCILPGRVLSVISRCKVSLRFFWTGFSSSAMFIIMDSSSLEEVLQVIHNEFFTEEVEEDAEILGRN